MIVPARIFGKCDLQPRERCASPGYLPAPDYDTPSRQVREGLEW